MKTAALIPAAGSGTRLGKGPKALLELRGISLLERCIHIFKPLVDDVVIAISAEMEKQVSSIANNTRIVLGGSSRQETVHNLAKASDADIVLVHDVARPFLSRDIVACMLSTLDHHPAASVVKPVADSLIIAQDGRVVDRDTLRAVQTPQGFQRDILVDIHKRALDETYHATDDASLARRYGHTVTLITGNSWLDKITTPADFERAEALAELWDEHSDIHMGR